MGELPSGGLVDRFGRNHSYLRLSITDRCNFRCTYCMPPEGLDWTPRSDLLSFEEIERLIRIFVRLGISKIRLTGGEPTARAGLTLLVRRLVAIPGLDQLTMTTNGHNLHRMARPLKEAGLQRINVSIDTLDPDQFCQMSGGGQLKHVMRGIHAARIAGLFPIRLNAVVLRNENEDQIMKLVRWAETHPQQLELRFIEYMPFQVRSAQCVTGAEVRSRIALERHIEPAVAADPVPGPAQIWRVPATGLRLGFIAPLSSKFCASCNRLRLQSNGQLRTCLAHEDTPSLRDLMRSGVNDDALSTTIRRMVLGKKEGHGCTVGGGQVFEGVMTGIGG
jgi:cyclic pyranopterin phosphate synthase